MTAPAVATSSKYGFLDQTHPIYDEHVERWTENERRHRGGDYILPELRRFRWETLPGMTQLDGDQTVAGEHYTARQRSAIYVNFPEMFSLSMKGHLFRNRPQPAAGLDFGTLGEVRRERNQAQPTNAELLYYNADGIGNDGSQWDNFWLSAWERASATGHRWMFAEAPVIGARNQQDVLNGARPYLVEYAPQQVPNWNFTRGQLDWAVVRVPYRKPVVNASGTLEGNSSTEGYMLLVRKGDATFGEEFQNGGWFMFDAEKRPIDGMRGSWDRTQGQIPLAPLFYERDTGVSGKATAISTDAEAWRNLLLNGCTTTRPAISRPAITELGQLAIAFMNMLSAMQYDAWDAASSIRFLMGVDKDSYAVAAAMWDGGSQTVAVPPVRNPDGSMIVPTLVDGSGGAVTADVFEKALTLMMTLAEKIAVQEVSSVPESSGVSKRMGFDELKAPRLSNIASEIEQSQNTMIHFLEQRWTGALNPSGSVAWPREFDLADVMADIAEFFDVTKVSGLSSATLESKLMVTGAKERGFITDAVEEQTIADEYKESAKKKQDASSLDAAFGGGLPPLNAPLVPPTPPVPPAAS